MAPFCRNYLGPAAALCGVLLSGAPAAAPAPSAGPNREQPIHLDAASSEVDYKSNTLVFSDVVISQGPMRVQADHARATGLDFANSRWNFEGHVRIDAEQRGSLRADAAEVEFKDNHIARATVTGKPAEFEQRRTDSDRMARGHADEIVYDVKEATVRLANDAWLSDGQSEISGPLLVYNIRGQRVQAAGSPDHTQRYTITIAPHALPAPGRAEAPKNPPEGNPGTTPRP